MYSLWSPFSAIEPRCFNWSLYNSVRSLLSSGRPFFSLYLIRTQSTICKYSWVLPSGKTPSKSSQRRQSSAVLRGFVDISLSLLSLSSLSNSFLDKPFLPLKYFNIKFLTSSVLNPSISRRVSQTFLTGIPASCRAVTTKWQPGSILPWMISAMNSGSLLLGNSSKPSSSIKTFDWLFWMNFINFSLSSDWIPRGRSWSSIASQRLDCTSMSRHRSNRTNWKSGKQPPGLFFFVAQS